MKTEIILTIIVIVAVLTSYKLGNDRGKRNAEKQIITEYDTIYSHEWKTCSVIVDRFYPVEKIKWNTDTIKQIDTVFILQEYFTTNYYDTTLVSDSTLKASLELEISRNELNKLTFDYSVLQKEKTVLKTIYEPEKWHYYFGTNISTYGNCYFGLSAQDKKGFIYTMDYDVMNRGLMVGIRAKIR